MGREQVKLVSEALQCKSTWHDVQVDRVKAVFSGWPLFSLVERRGASFVFVNCAQFLGKEEGGVRTFLALSLSQNNPYDKEVCVGVACSDLPQHPLQNVLLLRGYHPKHIQVLN